MQIKYNRTNQSQNPLLGHPDQAETNCLKRAEGRVSAHYNIMSTKLRWKAQVPCLSSASIRDPDGATGSRNKRLNQAVLPTAAQRRLLLRRTDEGTDYRVRCQKLKMKFPKLARLPRSWRHEEGNMIINTVPEAIATSMKILSPQAIPGLNRAGKAEKKAIGDYLLRLAMASILITRYVSLSAELSVATAF